jgi:hypothetical protein
MRIATIIVLGLVTFFAASAFAEKAPESVYRLAPTLKAWGENPLVVKAVKAQNAKGMSLDQIKQRDEQWRNSTGLDAQMRQMIDGPLGKELSKLEKSKPYFYEIFVMDNQGANVAMTNKTSDYWQGDEAKFTESFKGGAGAEHVSDVEFDESAQAYLVQVSVPVMDAGAAIGAITIGINIDELESQ